MGKRQALEITRRREPGFTVVSIRGTLDGTLDPTELAVPPGATVVYDLDAVELVTSSGVREWMTALLGISPRYYGFLNARPNAVAQFNMVPGFAANGHLLSLYLPYLCGSCESTFEVLVNAAAEHEWFVRGVVPDIRCLECGDPAHFAEDPTTYLRYVRQHPAPQPPRRLEALLPSVHRPASFHVEKEVVGNTTALKLQGPLTGDVGWKLVTAGVEAPVVLVLDDLTSIERGGGGRLIELLGSLPGRAALLNLPVQILEDLDKDHHEALAGRVRSLLTPAPCTSCDHTQMASAQLIDGRLRVMAPCEACGARLSDELLELVGPRAARLLDPLPPQSDVASYLEASGHFVPVTTPDLERGAAPSDQPPTLASGETIDRYRLDNEIGRGGMGRVFQAWDEKLRRTVALKILSEGDWGDERLRKRFFREARSTARLDHPNIVTVYDVGEMGGVPYIAMEFVAGERLDRYLKRTGRMSVIDAIRVAEQITDALIAAHDQKILHRDLKPTNIILLDDLEVRLLDFGLAKSLRSADEETYEPSRENLTADAVLGTPGYMAPEQLLGGDLGPATDVWSLAVTVYEMLTGKAPFGSPNKIVAILNAINRPVKKPSRLRKEIAPELDQLLLDALVVESERRLPDAREFSKRLRAARRVLAEAEALAAP